jgi:hypothetical protein
MKDFTKEIAISCYTHCFFTCFPWENDARLYENGMPARAELSVFQKAHLDFTLCKALSRYTKEIRGDFYSWCVMGV